MSQVYVDMEDPEEIEHQTSFSETSNYHTVLVSEGAILSARNSPTRDRRIARKHLQIKC